MVCVGSQLLYWDKPFVDAVKPNTCEASLIKAVEKRLWIADSSSIVPKHNQTLSTLREALLQPTRS